MSLSTIALIGRALLLFVSFSGLCAAIHKALKLNIFIAPYVTVCGIIVSLMLAGMLRVLEPVFWLLYAAGFAGILYALLTSPRRISKAGWTLILSAAAFIIFLVWRFYFCPLRTNDDVSHWALVSRHLLRHNCFPDKNATYVFFQSYPLGSSAFIYYVCKTIANNEGMYLVAFNFLLAPLFLPVFSLISPKCKRSCYPIALACFIFLFHFFRAMISLQVDHLLAFFGIGMIASIAYYRDNFKHALLTAIPGILAVVYVKNSGMFFALMSVLCLAWNANRHHAKRSTVFKIILLGMLGFIGAYLLWILHIRLSFPAALETKHAISISAYAEEVGRKGGAISLQILKALITKLLGFSRDQLLTLIFTLGCAGTIAYACFVSPACQGKFRKYWRALLFCASAYGIWIIMLYGMYLFSMPEEEALMAASFWRYNGTGCTYLMGLTAIVFFLFWGRGYRPSPKLFSVLPVLSILYLAATIIAYPFPQAQDLISAMNRPTSLSNIRRQIKTAREEYQLKDSDKLLVFCNPSDGKFGAYMNYLYHIKYEFETSDILMIAEKDGVFLAGSVDNKDYYTDITPFLEKALYERDALLVMDPSDTFEAQLGSFLESHSGNIDIIHSYNY